MKDVGGRIWACREDNAVTPGPHSDVSILCTTASVYIPLRLTVGSEWMVMADSALALMISEASPAPV